MYTAFAGFMRTVYRIKIEGAENEPSEGGTLVCVNHVSYADVIVLAASLKRQVRFFAKEELFHVPILSSFIRAMGAVPVKRGTGDVGAIKTIISLLEDGELVGVYPQGHRRPGVNPGETELAHGFGMISWRAHPTVLPVSIATKKRRVKLFNTTRVIIGKPIPFDEFGMESGNIDEYKRVTEYAFSRVVAAENTAYNEMTGKNN